MNKGKINFTCFPYLLPVICYLLFLSGCAAAPYTPAPKPQFTTPGIYHRVERGQTLWKISRIYGADLDEIARINRISEATSIEPGQLIFIPSAQRKDNFSSRSLGEDFAWPLRGRVIATFGQTYNDMVNKGINIQASGSQDVIASRSGKVTFYDPDFENFGKTIIIDHGDGFSTVYAKNSEVFVKSGDYIPKGTVISRVGSSGGKDNYLHFEIRKGYVAKNPYFYLP